MGLLDFLLGGTVCWWSPSTTSALIGRWLGWILLIWFLAGVSLWHTAVSFTLALSFTFDDWQEFYFDSLSFIPGDTIQPSLVSLLLFQADMMWCARKTVRDTNRHTILSKLDTSNLLDTGYIKLNFKIMWLMTNWNYEWMLCVCTHVNMSEYSSVLNSSLAVMTNRVCPLLAQHMWPNLSCR